MPALQGAFQECKIIFYGSSGKRVNCPLPPSTYIGSISAWLPVPSEVTEVMHTKINENECQTLTLWLGKSMTTVTGNLHYIFKSEKIVTLMDCGT